MRFLFAACLLFASTASSARAVVLYVDNLSGNDRYNGRSETLTGNRVGPVRTIRRALSLARLSDRIVLAANDEPYRESITFAGIDNSGLVGYPFVLEGNGAILEGAEPVPNHAWQGESIATFRFRPTGLGYQQLFNDGRPLTRRRALNESSALPELEPLEWSMRRQHIYLRVEKDKIPRDYNLTLAKRRTGVTLVHVRHVIIRNLTVQGFQVDGLNFHTADRDCTLFNVVARGNGRSGISVGPASRLAVNECVVGANGTSQFRVERGGIVNVAASDVFVDTAPLWGNFGGRLIVDGKDAEEEGTNEIDTGKNDAGIKEAAVDPKLPEPDANP